MHTLRFPLKTGRQKEQVLSKGFTAMGKLHNVIVKECKKRLRMLRRDPEYRALKKVYAKTDGACRREALSAMPSLWTRSFFVSTAGDVSALTIHRYVETQKTRP